MMGSAVVTRVVGCVDGKVLGDWRGRDGGRCVGGGTLVLLLLTGHYTVRIHHNAAGTQTVIEIV